MGIGELEQMSLQKIILDKEENYIQNPIILALILILAISFSVYVYMFGRSLADPIEDTSDIVSVSDDNPVIMNHGGVMSDIIGDVSENLSYNKIENNTTSSATISTTSIMPSIQNQHSDDLNIRVYVPEYHNLYLDCVGFMINATNIESHRIILINL